MLQTIYYSVTFILSFLLMLLYLFRWHKQFDVHMTAVFILVPIANLGYLLVYTVHEATAVTALLKIIYACGCFFPWLVTMFILYLCQIQVSRLVRIGSFLVSSVIFFFVLTSGYSDFFYKSLSVEQVGSLWVIHKEYGPVHFLHYICIILYLIADLIIIFYTYRKKKQVSRRILFLLFLPIPVSILGYFAHHFMGQPAIEFMPLSYMLSQFIYFLIAHRVVLYNVSEMVIESQVQSGDTGFITMDSKGRYLGCNKTAMRFLPELSCLTVDRPVRGNPQLEETVIRWLEQFQNNPEDNKLFYSRKPVGDKDAGDETIYLVNISYLHDGRKRCGYQIFLQDDTQNQKYIRLLDQYNSDLQEEVAAKTERIVTMHDRLVLGMATMVESRDNSTGGHIRRTSEGVRLLLDAIRKAGAPGYPDSFCKNIIKAAPMHDLGKIAVDDAILRKPGKFLPEEFEIMKSHAAEGARIVHEILQDTDDEEFRRIAENVAHYHHERWDGSGYPDGLKGEEIPLEARIMAIADVYDALVSKRVYKDAFSFEKANTIILEGMGTQFDARLQPYYEAALPELEAYYRKEHAES